MHYVLGIDIGGSKIDARLFAVTGDLLDAAPAWQQVQETQQGKAAHARQVAALIEQASLQAQKAGGALQSAGIASPGRFDRQGAIKPGTNSNMGLKPSEFDGVVLKSLYLTALGRVMPLYVANDAQVMLAGMLERLLPSDVGAYLLGRQVALLGVGTGLGHAIARVDDAGEYHFITDGHASKLCMPVDDDDRLALHSVQHEADVVICPDGSVRAEDLMRGPVMAALAGVEDSRQMDMATPRHAAVVCFAGTYMGRLIAMIASGQSKDTVPANGWNQQDKDEAALTQLYLIGGGLGASPLGERMVMYAKAELSRLALPNIELWHVSGEDSTARAAALLGLRRQL